MERLLVERIYADRGLARFVANEEGTTIAHSMSIVIGRIAIIEQLHVNSNRRRRGVGSMLLSRMETWATEQNCNTIIMRFAPCDFNDTFTLSKLLKANGYSFYLLFHSKKI